MLLFKMYHSFLFLLKIKDKGKSFNSPRLFCVFVFGEKTLKFFFRFHLKLFSSRFVSFLLLFIIIIHWNLDERTRFVEMQIKPRCKTLWIIFFPLSHFIKATESLKNCNSPEAKTCISETTAKWSSKKQFFLETFLLRNCEKCGILYQLKWKVLFSD